MTRLFLLEQVSLDIRTIADLILFKSKLFVQNLHRVALWHFFPCLLCTFLWFYCLYCSCYVLDLVVQHFFCDLRVVFFSKGNKIKKSGNKLSVSALVDAVLSRTRTSKVWEYFTPNTAKTEALAYASLTLYTRSCSCQNHRTGLALTKLRMEQLGHSKLINKQNLLPSLLFCLKKQINQTFSRVIFSINGGISRKVY